MKSRWRNQFVHIESASKFHNKVRTIFTTDKYFKRLKCFQEVPVVDIVTDYENTSHHYDWYIEELAIVIELHGAQHYQVVNYGNIGYDDAVRNFNKMQNRDQEKRDACIEQGLLYLEVSYKHYKKLDAKLLKELIFRRADG